MCIDIVHRDVYIDMRTDMSLPPSPENFGSKPLLENQIFGKSKVEMRVLDQPTFCDFRTSFCGTSLFDRFAFCGFLVMFSSLNPLSNQRFPKIRFNPLREGYFQRPSRKRPLFYFHACVLEKVSKNELGYGSEKYH